MADVVSDLLEKLRLGDDAGVMDEIAALLAIYGDDSVQAYTPSRPPSVNADLHGNVDLASTPDGPRYLSIRTTLPPPHDDIPLRLLVTLAASYPHVAPQLQVQTLYLGDHSADYLLFGDILRVYMHDGADAFTSGDAALFDGIERAREIAGAWYAAKEAAKPAPPPPLEEAADTVEIEVPHDTSAGDTRMLSSPRLPARNTRAVEVAQSEPIVDRKSTFVGWAARITSPDQVSTVLAYIKSDRKVARATHNIVAWRCRTEDGVLHQDNDDDGESAAGARLAHLLHILDVDNALVVCSRWFGGIHLGADRFKHINAAARTALELADLLPPPPTKGKKHGKH